VSRQRGELIKKYRIDREYVHDLGVECGLYVNPSSGAFYARVPEIPDGELFEDASLGKLRKTVEAAMRSHYGLDWKHILRVSLPNPMRYRTIGIGSWSGNGQQWDPLNVDTASDVIGPLIFVELWVAKRPDGTMVTKNKDGRMQVDARHGERELDLPFSEPLREALVSFQAKVRMLDHAIRGVLHSPDVVPKLLAGAALQLTGPDGQYEGYAKPAIAELPICDDCAWNRMVLEDGMLKCHRCGNEREYEAPEPKAKPAMVNDAIVLPPPPPPPPRKK